MHACHPVPCRGLFTKMGLKIVLKKEEQYRWERKRILNHRGVIFTILRFIFSQLLVLSFCKNWNFLFIQTIFFSATIGFIFCGKRYRCTGVWHKVAVGDWSYWSETSTMKSTMSGWQPPTPWSDRGPELWHLFLEGKRGSVRWERKYAVQGSVQLKRQGRLWLPQCISMMSTISGWQP